MVGFLQGFLTLFGRVAFSFFNMGVAIGLIFLALILIRPVTNPLIRPRHRVWLWGLGWIAGFSYVIYSSYARITFLPISFRSLISPRIRDRFYNVPEYLPTNYGGPGEYTVAIPGGSEVSIQLDDARMMVVGGIFLALLTLFCLLERRQLRRLRGLASQGEVMSREDRERYGVNDDRVEIRLCENLPTSFVFVPGAFGATGLARFTICLQKELSPERMDLILRHEMAHVEMNHLRTKGWITGAMVFTWWNPVIWLAHRLTCRDIELACDEAVLAQLEPAERREYARTLTELASGKPMWGGLTSFGECDAAIRVKNVVAWKPEREWTTIISMGALILLLMFFYGGDWSTTRQDTDYSDGPDISWGQYIRSEELMEDITAHESYPGVEIREIWVRTERQLLLLGADGQWYYATLYVGRGDWWVNQIIPMRSEPFLNEYTRIK